MDHRLGARGEGRRVEERQEPNIARALCAYLDTLVVDVSTPSHADASDG